MARPPTFSLSCSVKKALSGADAGSVIAIERRPNQDADDPEVHLVRRRGGDGGKALYAIGGGSLAVLVAFWLLHDPVMCTLHRMHVLTHARVCCVQQQSVRQELNSCSCARVVHSADAVRHA